MPAPLPKPGECLGKYEIIRELAIGGMAAIYLARVRGQAGFEKNVVLKCILPNLATDRGFVANFLDEARLAATLRHSNIADVFDVGAEAKHYFFAMEYVHGENARTVRLEAKQQGSAIPVEVALATVLGTTAALAYAHDKRGPDGPLDIVHRDVSPSNILISFEGAIKLVDFGIARASLRSSARTRTGMRKGKVPYMSPEQCRGKTVDRRSDLFALGTVLYELTTMQRPFRGNSDFEVMDAIVTCTPEPPGRFIGGYAPDLERIVMRLLALSPDARYQSAHELAEDLEAFTREDGISTAAHVVTRYMRELFADAPDLDRDTITDPSPPLMPARGSRDTRPPRLAGEDTAHGLDMPTTPFVGENTRRDLAVPFDPVEARSAELLAGLDHDAPANETPDARAYRRVDTLLQQATGWLAYGEADKAFAAVELALDEDASSARVQELLQHHVGTIAAVYEALLEDPYRVLVLARPLVELTTAPMEDEARLVLPLVDGVATIREIIDRSGMQRLEVYHHLCQLLMRGLLR